MVRDHPHSHICPVAFSVSVPREFFYSVDHPGEYIRVIVAGLALKHHTEPFESHSRVHVPVRKRFELSAGLPVELHEHQVPYLDHERVACIDQLPSGDGGPFLIAAQVYMDLAARPARPCVSHLPEVVVLVSEQYPVFRDVKLPSVSGFRVHIGPVSRVPFEYGHVKSVLVDPVHFGEQFPGPVYGLGLEIVAEAPVAEHLEHRMMV